MEQQKQDVISSRADGPIHKYRLQVQRLATTGLTPAKISALTGIPIFVLDFHFARETTTGEAVATLFHKPSAAKQPAKQKSIYSTDPIPPIVVFCHENGREMTYDAYGNEIRRIRKGFEHLPGSAEFLSNCRKPTRGPTNSVVESSTGVGDDQPQD